MPSIPTHANSTRQPAPVPARLFGRILGFDFHLVFARRCQSYANGSTRLCSAPGSRLLDNEVYVAGDDQHRDLRRVRSSSKLIVVVGPGAALAVGAGRGAIDADKPIIAIDLLGDLSERHGESSRPCCGTASMSETGGVDAQEPSHETLGH